MDRVISTQLAVAAGNSKALTIVASSAFVLTGVVTTFLGPILPTLASRWALSDSQGGYFLATQFLGSILGVSISSMLLPRRGFRFSIALSYCLMAAGVGGLIVEQWRLALLGTLTFGIGLGVAIPSTNLLISTVNPEHRASALSILNFCWGLGAVLAPLALIFFARWDHARPFVPALSGFLLLSVLGLILSPDGPPHTEERPSSAGEEPPSKSFIAALGGMFFLYVAIEASVGGWIATLAQREAAGTGPGWALAPMYFWAGLLGGRGTAPIVLRRVHERTLALTSLAVACSGICILILSSHLHWINVAGVVTGWGLAAVFPITIALLSNFPMMEKQIAGPMFGLAGLGGTIMPWLVGVISTASRSLQKGLMAPLLAALLLFCLHALTNRSIGSAHKFSTQKPAGDPD